MARFARIVVRDCLHHVTARGNRREPVFFENGDHDVYRRLLAGQAQKARVEIWATHNLSPDVRRMRMARASCAGLT
jgi:putative transposase